MATKKQTATPAEEIERALVVQYLNKEAAAFDTNAKRHLRWGNSLLAGQASLKAFYLREMANHISDCLHRHGK